MSRLRVHLDTPAGKQFFPPGSYTIGRADECDVVLASGRCSRHHARLVVSETQATLEDLSSANGTFVNGARLTGAQALNHGDFVVVGGEIGIEVSIEIEATPSEPQIRERSPSRTEESGPHLPPTARVSMDEVLEAAADHLISNGQAELAERTLGRWLETAMAAAQGGEWREDALIDMSVRCAAKLARALPSRRWVDYVLELSSALSRPMSEDQANLLNDAIGSIGVSPEPLGRYIDMLRALSAHADIARAMDEAEAWRECCG